MPVALTDIPATESEMAGGDATATIQTQLSMAIGTTLHGSVGTSGDRDYIAVDLVAGQTYTFAMVGIGANVLTDSLLNLRDATGTTVLATNDDGLQNNNSVITYTATTSGRYFLDAGAFGGQSGDYGIAASLGTRADFDLAMIAGAIDTHLTWAATRGQGTTLTYAFRDTGEAGTTGFSHFTEAQKVATRAILDQYSEFSNLNFTEVNPGGTSNDATLLYANYSANDGAGGYGYYPGSRSAGSVSGDVWVNDSNPSQTTQGPGTWFQHLILHEIGHTLGLSHPGMYNAGVGQNITYANSAQFLQDSGQYSVMSYFGASETGGPGGYSDTLMLADVTAMQLMYGANMTTRTGNTVYGFGSNAGAVYDFTRNTNPFLTIWDAGGIDTLNASTYTMGQLIDLREGQYSDIGGYTQNIAIALGAVIERAMGGRGADLIIGNDAGNQLFGGDGDDSLIGAAGNDVLYGGAGNDRMFGGAGHDVYLVANSTDQVTELADQGTDSVTCEVDFTLAAGIAVERLVVAVTAGGLRLTGNELANIMIGGSGVDTLTGGEGNDRFYVQTLGDRVIEGAGGGTDLIVSSVNWSLASTPEVENLFGSGSAGLNLTGNAVRNFIIGTTGADILTGGAGADVLRGGVDTMRDTFVFTTSTDSLRGAGRDMVCDFISGGDVIDLSAIDPNAGVAGNQSFGFAGLTATAMSIWTATAAGSVWVYADVTGDRVADMEIRLLGVATVVAADFLL